MIEEPGSGTYVRDLEGGDLRVVVHTFELIHPSSFRVRIPDGASLVNESILNGSDW